ncbi:uncharacterized protein CC84DRAFT_1165226 [Paraphaeosphaeria sporulosa]|uniref:Uncharacterized protein n=1 Tax=Paraphaeosphaeria sporulosa TaxID=1460663 RepID=A0A177CB08_9PLEO|nr:uncharacterized protein CC84DRAFT_1165226 [Paraphaeosphaeria sporulosa]OAG04853.1 hypothetical protein CC84DRAFT_1165226 [Paraphaeosphaeria sporulosa]
MEGEQDTEDAEAAPTNGDTGDLDAEEEASVQPEDEDEPILVIEEVVEEVVGDDTDDDNDDDDDQPYAAQDQDDLAAESDALHAAHEAASDTELDDEQPVVVTQQIEQVEIQLAGREDAVEEAPEALDLRQEIQEITESTPHADPEHTIDSLFEGRPSAFSQVDDHANPNDSDDEDEAASFSAPAGVAPVPNMLPTAPFGS